jgi:glycosyltransferase involved in cell wall biosynthesis
VTSREREIGNYSGPVARVCVVATGRPWEEDQSGAVLRHLAMLRALGSVGPLAYLSLEGPERGGETERTAPPASVRELEVIPYRSTALEGRAYRRWLISALLTGARCLPLGLRSRSLSDAGTARAVSFVSGHDLVWFMDEDAFALLGSELSDGRQVTVVDLYDLHEETFRQRLQLLEWRTQPLRAARSALSLWLQGRTWQRWNERIARSVSYVLVTKDADRMRLGHANVRTVPNGCTIKPPSPVRPAQWTPRLLFHGTMRYGPNNDAARFLVEEIAPLVAADLGRPIDVRIVGEAPYDIRDLGQRPFVSVTGYVDDIDSELDAADVVVVPLRIGSGTRLKILEAFSFQVPVVSTSVGCDGIDAQDGVHLLVADGAEDFAQACVIAISDDSIRADLTAKAYALVEERFDWAVIEKDLSDWLSGIVAIRS